MSSLAEVSGEGLEALLAVAYGHHSCATACSATSQAGRPAPHCLEPLCTVASTHQVPAAFLSRPHTWASFLFGHSTVLVVKITAFLPPVEPSWSMVCGGSRALGSADLLTISSHSLLLFSFWLWDLICAL
jgi:hypothetical protein